MADPGKEASMSFSSSIGKASEEDLQVYCQPCDDEGPRISAYGYCTDCKEHLCKTCFTVHKKHKLSKHHILLDASSMPRSLQQPIISHQTRQTDNLVTPCVKHPKESIKFYCNTHEECICTACVTLNHQHTICKINYIPDISEDIIDSVEYQVYLQATNSLADKYQKIKEDVSKLTYISNSSLQNVIADIKRYRRQINKILDELERQAEDAANVIIKENSKRLRIVETTCEDAMKSLKTSSDMIKQLNASKQADKLFMELKRAGYTLKDIDNNKQQLKSYNIKGYTFKQNNSIISYLKKEEMLGILSPKPLNAESDPPATQLKSRQTSHLGDILVQTSKDVHLCWITGITILTPDHLIITDYNNKAIKMVNIRNKSVTDQLPLPDGPWDITTLTSIERTVAVTLPDIQAVQFKSILSNKLTNKRTMKVDGECRGISCHQDRLLVTFSKPAKLLILNINGDTLREITNDKILKHPLYVTSNATSIYVSDWYMKTVIRFNWQGEVTDSYGSLDKPEGIVSTTDGSMFVCDMSRGVIEEISGNCTNGTTVLKNLTSPRAVCFCSETKSLYYTSVTSFDKPNNSLHIYRLS